VAQSRLNIGDNVYVPRSRVGLHFDSPSAFYKGAIQVLNKHSIRVSLPKGALSSSISKSVARKTLGVLILQIGDYETEVCLLKPLTKSILQYFRLLLSDDELRHFSVRSLSEFKSYWIKNHALISHVVLIGHGKNDSILFGQDWIKAEAIRKDLEAINSTPKQFLSLCCQTGYAAFAKSFSNSQRCDSFIAPFHSIHGAMASQFCQTYFAHHLLRGQTTRTAFKQAREGTPNAAEYRLWRNGKLIAGAKMKGHCTQ